MSLATAAKICRLIKKTTIGSDGWHTSMIPWAYLSGRSKEVCSSYQFTRSKELFEYVRACKPCVKCFIGEDKKIFSCRRRRTLEMPGMIVYWKIIFITTLISCCNWWRRELFQPPACRSFRYSYSDGKVIQMNQLDATMIFLRWVIPVVLSRYKYVKKILFCTVTKHN